MENKGNGNQERKGRPSRPGYGRNDRSLDRQIGDEARLGTAQEQDDHPRFGGNQDEEEPRYRQQSYYGRERDPRQLREERERDYNLNYNDPTAYERKYGDSRRQEHDYQRPDYRTSQSYQLYEREHSPRMKQETTDRDLVGYREQSNDYPQQDHYENRTHRHEPSEQHYRWNEAPQQKSRGQHYGKGPKGFTFSDEDVSREVGRKLYEHGEIDASEVNVEVREGEVTLSGTVDSRATKNRIEDIIEYEVSGVKDINNQLRVKREGRP